MKSIFRILLWMSLGLLAAACASTTATPTAAPTNSVDTSEPTQAPSADRPYAPSDVTLVGTTGRPQFLDSYADW